MESAEKTIINILKMYLKDEYAVSFDDVNWEKVVYYARLHNIQGIVYTVLNKIDEYKGIANKLQSDFYAITMHNVVMETEMKKVIDNFNNAEIKHIPVKGFSVKKCYPDPELRSMGDVDVLIESKDREKSNEILLNMGFELDEFSSFNHVWNYKNNKLYLEVHTRLIHEKLFNGFDYATYFSDAIEHGECIEGYTYELKCEYHLLFLLMHMAKHFFGEGCGIRMVFDIPVFIEYYRDKLDWDFLFAELKRIKLYKFALSIFYLCKVWFAIDIPNEIPEMEQSTYESMCKYIFEGGVFGFENRNQGSVKLRREIKNNDTRFMRCVHSLRGIVKWLCPDCETMRERSVWFKNKPTILLPIAWIRRWCMAIKVRKGSILKKLILILFAKKEADEQYNLLNNIGLYD
jgi:virulence-associated protein VapD